MSVMLYHRGFCLKALWAQGFLGALEVKGLKSPKVLQDGVFFGFFFGSVLGFLKPYFAKSIRPRAKHIGILLEKYGHTLAKVWAFLWQSAHIHFERFRRFSAVIPILWGKHGTYVWLIRGILLEHFREYFRNGMPKRLDPRGSKSI